jgi:hypothetical protein
VLRRFDYFSGSGSAETSKMVAALGAIAAELTMQRLGRLTGVRQGAAEGVTLERAATRGRLAPPWLASGTEACQIVPGICPSFSDAP